MLYPSKSGFKENFKFTTSKSPFLLWERDLGIGAYKKPINLGHNKFE